MELLAESEWGGDVSQSATGNAWTATTNINGNRTKADAFIVATETSLVSRSASSEKSQSPAGQRELLARRSFMLGIPHQTELVESHCLEFRYTSVNHTTNIEAEKTYFEFGR